MKEGRKGGEGSAANTVRKNSQSVEGVMVVVVLIQTGNVDVEGGIV